SLRVHLRERRAHHEDGQEQREADQHLVRRDGRRVERGPEGGEDDQDPGEAGHHDQQGGAQRDQREQRQDRQVRARILVVARQRHLQRRIGGAGRGGGGGGA